MKKKYNTPHRCHVVKTRMTEEEYADFTERLKHYDMSQSEFIRQAITRATIRPIVTVSPVNDELLSAVGRLTAEYGKIGGNLNQIARALNEYGTPYNALSVEVRAAISDLAALKFEVLRKVGDAVGNIQTCRNGLSPTTTGNARKWRLHTSMWSIGKSCARKISAICYGAMGLCLSGCPSPVFVCKKSVAYRAQSSGNTGCAENKCSQKRYTHTSAVS